MKRFYLFVIPFLSQVAYSGTPSDQITLAIREKLSPVVTSALQEHCGEDCPSFRIDPQFKKTPSGILENLGFSTPQENPDTPQVQSVTISVLIQEKVPQDSREALRQILAHRITNELPVPVLIQVKTLSALSPSLEKKSRPKGEPLPTPPAKPEQAIPSYLDWTKELAWPSTLFLVASLGLLGFLLYLRNRRLLHSDRLQTLMTQEEASLPAQPATEATDSLSLFRNEIFKTRSEDLLWLIESLSLQREFKSLEQISRIFPPQDLSSRLKFSRLALSALATLSTQKPSTGSAKNHEDLVQWLNQRLNQAHWQRLEEESLPLTRFKRLPRTQLTYVFSHLKSAPEKARALSSLPQEKWPVLLSQLSSDERVELAMAILDDRNSTREERTQIESQICESLLGILDDSHADKNDFESLSLYLTDTENKNLWETISKQNQSSQKPVKSLNVSIDSLIDELSSEALVEICTQMDIGTLSTLLQQLSPSSNKKILGQLPKTFLERLRATRSPGSEAEQMMARAHLLDAYRKFTSGSMVQ